MTRARARAPLRPRRRDSAGRRAGSGGHRSCRGGWLASRSLLWGGGLVADRRGGAVKPVVVELVDKEGTDVGAGDRGADLVLTEEAGADGAGRRPVRRAGEARDRPVEV